MTTPSRLPLLLLSLLCFVACSEPPEKNIAYKVLLLNGTEEALFVTFGDETKKVPPKGGELLSLISLPSKVPTSAQARRINGDKTELAHELQIPEGKLTSQSFSVWNIDESKPVCLVNYSGAYRNLDTLYDSKSNDQVAAEIVYEQLPEPFLTRKTYYLAPQAKLPKSYQTGQPVIRAEFYLAEDEGKARRHFAQLFVEE